MAGGALDSVSYEFSFQARIFNMSSRRPRLSQVAALFFVVALLFLLLAMAMPGKPKQDSATDPTLHAVVVVDPFSIGPGSSHVS